MRAATSPQPEGPITYRLAAFDALSGRDVYDALALRAQVFVVEQQCVYLDPDGLDGEATHLLGRDGRGVLGTYARIFFGDEGAAHRIGRVIVHPALRSVGAGRALMREAIACCEACAPGPIELAAQAHLERFYGSLGFVAISPPYVHDGIDHLDMRRA
jgi:ElaA protein